MFVVGSERRIFFAAECTSAIQGHARSLILAPIERAYDFLLVINSNFGPILHRYCRDTASYWLKIANFPTPSHLTRSLQLGMNPFEFLDDIFTRKLESLGYPSVKIS